LRELFQSSMQIIEEDLARLSARETGGSLHDHHACAAYRGLAITGDQARLAIAARAMVYRGGNGKPDPNHRGHRAFGVFFGAVYGFLQE